MTDYAKLRTTMVDTQVRPADVTLFPVIDAMLAVEREKFVPDRLRSAAYAGEHIPLGEDRVMLDPRTFAKMLDALAVEPDETVLDIGVGYGYSSAVLSRLADAVIALEDQPAFAAEAEANLSEAEAHNVAVVTGELAAGAPEHGPYDAIMLQGAVEMIPDALVAQLKPGGRIAALFQTGALGVCRIGHKAAGGVTWRYVFNASAPVLPGFSARPAFVF